MRHLFCIIFMTCGSLSMLAQQGFTEPRWVKHKPVSPSIDYYYRITQGEGKTYDQAYAGAFAKAIYENTAKRGITVSMNASAEEIEADIAKQVSVADKKIKMYINKACEYWYKDESIIRIFVLWQIGTDFSHDVRFEEYDGCNQL